MDQPPLYRFENVRVRDLFSVRHFEIRSGAVTIFRGPSGCGKTTMMRLLNRMTPCDGGELYFRGAPIRTFDPIALRREAVMLAQQPQVFAGTVREDAVMGCVLAERDVPADGEIRQALDAVRLPKTLEEDPSRFSGGEMQRLALARVLLMDPPILLLDEPSSGLDQVTEDAVFAVIRGSRERGRTVALATHARDLEGLGEFDLFDFDTDIDTDADIDADIVADTEGKRNNG